MRSNESPFKAFIVPEQYLSPHLSTTVQVQEGHLVSESSNASHYLDRG